MVTLDALSAANIHAVLALEVNAEQKATYPRSNGYSIAEGHFPGDDDPVWMRAICNGGTPIGFMMTSERPSAGEYFLWRMMIDHRHQGRGHAKAAMRLLVDRLERTDNPRLLLLSHLRENVRASHFYRSLGFTYTGKDLGGGDLEMALPLQSRTD